MIRRARIQDAKIIHGLLHYYADRGLLLSRSLSDIYDHIRDYFVSVDGEDDRVTGVCCTHIVWEDLAEIRSLAVEEAEHDKKIGSRLVDACLSDAVTLGIFRIFTLTYVPDYFKRFGFEIVDKSLLPHKVWADCIKCVKFPECDETAMLLEL